MAKTIKYKNYNIHYSLAGEGELLLFLHGWPTNSKLWKAQIDALQSHYRTLVIDWLGFGKSDKPLEHHYTFTHKKEILDVVLGELLPAAEKVNIVVHDIGGPAGILWTYENPGRVRHLILLNTVLFKLSTPLDKMSHFFFNFPLLKNIFVSPFGLRTLLGTLTQSRGTGVKARIRAVLGAHEGFTGAVRLRAILEPMNEGRKNELLTLEEKFQAVAAEKYLIIADKDPLCYAHIKKLSDNNPEIPVYMIENCNHYIPIDRPDELNEILLRILVN